MKDAAVVILAAGKGTRLGGSIPKPLVEVGGIPLIQPIIEQALASTWHDIFVVISEYTCTIQDRYTDPRLTYILVEPLGTGYCTLKALQQTEARLAVIVQSDDSFFYPLTLLESLILAVRDSDLTVAIQRVEISMPYARVDIAVDGHLLAIHKSADNLLDPPPKNIVAGLYAGNRHWISEHLLHVPFNKKGEQGFPNIIDDALQEGAAITTYPLPPGSWHGINTPYELHQAQLKFSNQSLV